jgi:hypothetical protein
MAKNFQKNSAKKEREVGVSNLIKKIGAEFRIVTVYNSTSIWDLRIH